MSLFIASTGLIMSPRFLAAHLPVLAAGMFLVVLGKSILVRTFCVFEKSSLHCRTADRRWFCAACLHCCAVELNFGKTVTSTPSLQSIISWCRPNMQISLVVWMFQYPPRTAIAVGLGMAQIGEFAFVLLSSASQHGLLPYQVYMLLMGESQLQSWRWHSSDLDQHCQLLPVESEHSAQMSQSNAQ